MAHIHGAQKAVAHGAAGHAAHEAMGHGMAHLVKAGASHPATTAGIHHLAGGAAATGAAVITAGSHTGRTLMGRIFKHPVVLFGLGVAVGYTIHKYRKEIILAANDAAEKSKDFVLQQRESLEDILEEGKDKAG
jgi:hypothetical protein